MSARSKERRARLRSLSGITIEERGESVPLTRVTVRPGWVRAFPGVLRVQVRRPFMPSPRAEDGEVAP
jgi:hypothetical protein